VTTPRWTIAVFAMNEAATIAACLESLDANCAGVPARILLLLNGSTDGTRAVAEGLRLRHATLEIHAGRVADKSNAINEYVHRLRDPGALAFFADGYVTAHAGALAAIERALAAHPHAHVASAVPMSGRSAPAMRAQLLKGGGISGNLFACTAGFLDRLVAAGLRLPLFLYRGDGLIGSMAAHDLDAMGTPWDDSRLIGVADATYEFRPLSPFRWRDVQRQLRREVRQARGALESAAVKAVIYQGGYAALPRDADTLLRDFVAANGLPPAGLKARILRHLALKDLRAAPPPPDDPRFAFERVLVRSPG
jgi:glycosyltransferase involved in cell wall biosynthesis